MHDEPLLGVAKAISEGRDVDWPGVASSLPESDRAVLRELQALAALADLHEGSPSSGTRPDDIAGSEAWGGLTLVESVGQGAFGEVFRAWDPQLDREIALKLLSPEISPGAISEGRRLARVKHTNVVTVYAADEHDGQVGLSMEFIHGRTLESLLDALGPFGAREAVGIGIDLCRALAAVHGAGLLHRDVKTQNVMRESGGRIVLMDFGASAVASSPGLVGTPLYLAPELLAGGEATTASDFYALGVLLFRLLTHRYPVAESSIDAVIDAHRANRTQRLRDVRPDLPERLVAIIERALHPDPARRFASAGEMEDALVRSLDEHVRPRAAARRGRGLLGRWAAGLAIVVAVAVGATQMRVFNRPGTAVPVKFGSIAVLPIRNLTGDGTREYLADGMTEAFISRLSTDPR